MVKIGIAESMKEASKATGSFSDIVIQIILLVIVGGSFIGVGVSTGSLNLPAGLVTFLNSTLITAITDNAGIILGVLGTIFALLTIVVLMKLFGKGGSSKGNRS